MTTNKPHWSEMLAKTGACIKAVEWARTQPNPRTAWRRCKRGDWMLWIAGYQCKQGSPTHRAVVLAACECARLALPHVPRDEKRPRKAIELAERWARRETGVTLRQVKRAADDAYYATRDCLGSVLTASNAAISAADAAWGGCVGGNASDAVLAVVDVGTPDAYDLDTVAKTLAKCATIVRRHLRVGT